MVTTNSLSLTNSLLFTGYKDLVLLFDSSPATGRSLGLAQAIDGWTQTLYSLAELQQALTTDANPLGFTPDFLMLAENFFGVENHFDSFVAATGWVLSFRIRSGGNVLLNIDELTDVELLFRHSSIGRLQ